MDKTILVSIICVTYNAEKHLQNFFESIHNYKPQNCELIIFDGRSTDKTSGIIVENSMIVDQYISDSDTGIYNAMNKALTFAKGKWFYFIGSDDLLLPDFQQFVEHLKDEHTIYHGNILMDSETIIRSSNPYRLSKENISHQTIFYPSSVFEKYTYNEKYRICADYNLNLKLRGDKNYQFQYLPLTPAKFGTDGLSSIKRDELFEDIKPKIVRKNLGFIIYLRLLFKIFKLSKGK